MEWDDATIARLRKLWVQEPQISTNEIARILNGSKNAIVGKAHRLGLPARPSPIRRGGEGGPKPPKRSGGSPALAAGTLLKLPDGVMARAPEPAPRVVTGVSKPCCWPIGEVGAADFHFCGLKGEPGRPYCARHCAIAYVRVRDRDEYAA